MHTLRARLEGDATWAPASITRIVDTTRKSANLVIEGATVVLANHPFDLFGRLAGAAVTPVPTGTISILAGDTELGTGDAGVMMVTVPGLPAGEYEFVADYSGDDNFLAESSEPLVVTVLPDEVEASNVGVEYDTFYPFKDDYRDTVRISGTRNEPLKVEVKVRDDDGDVVARLSAARSSGAYAIRWNGRTRSGALLPAGPYRVAQTADRRVRHLEDVHRHRAAVPEAAGHARGRRHEEGLRARREGLGRGRAAWP